MGKLKLETTILEPATGMTLEQCGKEIVEELESRGIKATICLSANECKIYTQENQHD